MIDFYRRLVRKCQTVNQQNKVRIALENRMTPLELEIFRSELQMVPGTYNVFLGMCVKQLRRKLPGAFKSWHMDFEVYLSARNWVKMLDLAYLKSGKPYPEHFRRHKLRQQLTLYKDGGDKHQKTLVICFSGNAQRMMMPMPVFLQHLDAKSMDVAFLKDPQRKGYQEGVDSIAPNLEQMFEELQTLLNIEEYRRVVAIGTSAGGLPAILATLKLGLNAGLSVGGSDPEDPRWRMVDGISTEAMTPLDTKKPTVTPELFLAFGADRLNDRAKAEALAAVVPARLLPISDPAEPVGHNALYSLVKQGKLSEFLHNTIDHSISVVSYRY